MPVIDRIDQVREQVEQARDERDLAYAALAEVEALAGGCVIDSALSQIGTVLRRFRLDLPPARQRQYDRRVAEARSARRFATEDGEVNG